LSTWTTAMRISDDAYLYSGVVVAECYLRVDLRHRSLQCSDAEDLEPDSIVVHVETNPEHAETQVEDSGDIGNMHIENATQAAHPGDHSPAVPQDLPKPE